MKTHPPLVVLGALPIAAGLCTPTPAAADQAATWNSTTSNGGDATEWNSNPLASDNGGGHSI
jgi:hypothetical protein